MWVFQKIVWCDLLCVVTKNCDLWCDLRYSVWIKVFCDAWCALFCVIANKTRCVMSWKIEIITQLRLFCDLAHPWRLPYLLSCLWWIVNTGSSYWVSHFLYTHSLVWSLPVSCTDKILSKLQIGLLLNCMKCSVVLQLLSVINGQLLKLSWKVSNSQSDFWLVYIWLIMIHDNIRWRGNLDKSKLPHRQNRPSLFAVAIGYTILYSTLA